MCDTLTCPVEAETRENPFVLRPAAGSDRSGGAGFAGRSAEWNIYLGDVFATVTEEEGSIGLGAGLGYDLQVARNFFITPALDFVYTGTEGDGASLLLFTVGATWHQAGRSLNRSSGSLW
jgi:hypothetical protein